MLPILPTKNLNAHEAYPELTLVQNHQWGQALTGRLPPAQ